MASGNRDVLVAGVGMVPFTKPGGGQYELMGAEAIKLALADAGVGYESVQQAYAGYVYGNSCSGQRVVYGAGLTGIPIFNVNNNCASGSSALFLARQAIESGALDCALAVGFEQMNPGPLAEGYADRASVFDNFDKVADELIQSDLPPAIRFFGAAGIEHMQRYGTTFSDFAKVRAKASRHAANNPLSVFRNVMTEEDVLNAPVIWPGVMTKPMACPPTCGAAAALLVSPEFARRHNLKPSARIVAQSMATDTAATFEAHNMIHLVGYELSQRAASAVYEQSGVGPQDIAVVELHDCFVQAEVLTYEALGLCGEGGAQKFIADGDNSYGGKVVTNPSGGLLSKGHPLGATGLAQCFELTQQLRGNAGARQVENARHALQHNLGLGGAIVVTLYERV
jgi:sterol carrier protein 2